MTAARLPNPTRFIMTTCPTTGESSTMIAAPVELLGLPGYTLEKGNIWHTEKFPAEVQGEADMANQSKGMVADGSSFFYADFPPGASAAMHFTASIDYAIVLAGSITHETSDGKVITANAGDTIVQRGTLHAWHNRTDEWTRMVFVMIPAEKVLTEKKLLVGDLLT